MHAIAFSIMIVRIICPGFTEIIDARLKPMDIEAAPCKVLRADPTVLFPLSRLPMVYDVFDVVARPDAMPRRISARIGLTNIESENSDIKKNASSGTFFFPNLSNALPPVRENTVNDNGNRRTSRLYCSALYPMEAYRNTRNAAKPFLVMECINPLRLDFIYSPGNRDFRLIVSPTVMMAIPAQILKSIITTPLNAIPGPKALCPIDDLP